MEDRKRAKKEASVTPWKKEHREQGMDESNIFESSSVKYCVSKSTPLLTRFVFVKFLMVDVYNFYCGPVSRYEGRTRMMFWGEIVCFLVAHKYIFQEFQ